MEVVTFPNFSRPGVGLAPRRETQRPLLPQHARHCPVLEAGSGLGYLVYPPLEKHESFFVEYKGEGAYQFVYFMSGPDGKSQSIFSATMALPVGSIGPMKEEVTFAIPDPPLTREGALRIAHTFVIAEDLGTPPGAVTLRGATNFRTPFGWDTVYVPVLNMIDRPLAPMLAVRVETDWYTHESEFRYVLQPGQVIPGSHSMPIGQIFFVPREETTLRECTEEELGEIRRAREEFLAKKAATKLTTRYGLQYSPHYIRQSRQVQSAAQEEEES